MHQPVKAYMTGAPTSVDEDASALAALELMVERGIRHLPVLDSARTLVGIVSIDDLRAALPFAVALGDPPGPQERGEARDWQVGEIMTHAPETARPDTTLAEAAERMASRRIGCLPVVDEDGDLVGILSETDVLQAVASSLWTDELREQKGKAAELEVFVDALRAEREKIASRLDRLHDVERTLSAEIHDVPTDLAERGERLSEVQMAETLDERAARRLDAIDRALDRAGRGEFGACARCGEAIPLTRLRALPGTEICIACARREEAP